MLCDKTGTLTQNLLIFSGLSTSNSISFERGTKTLAEFCSEHSHDATFTNFWRCVCLCHDVSIIDIQGHKSLSGSSQDELVLINAAAETKLYKFEDKTASAVTLSINGQTEEYNIVKFIDFTPERKMMSIVVENVKTKELALYCKGADTSVLSRLSA